MSPYPPVSWSRLLLAYLNANGTPVPAMEVTATAEAVAAQARARIGVETDRLRAGQIKAEEFRAKMQAAIKVGHAAELVLARGGMDEIRPSDWTRLSERIAIQFDFLDGHIERITTGKYGPGLQSSAFNVHSNAFANSMRSTYHNERKELHAEQGFKLARRLLAGGVKHCAECQRLADAGWIAMDKMPGVGECECRQNCQCSIIYKRAK